MLTGWKMRRDLKMGILAGLALTVCAMIWYSIQRDFSPEKQFADPDIQTRAGPSGLAEQFGPEDIRLSSVETLTIEAVSQPGEHVGEYKEPPKITTTRFHIVRKGETLSDIAKEYYGRATEWLKIQHANPEALKNPHSLKAGTKLTIPDLYQRP